MVVHDFSGHPFQAQLARKLASRGLDVTHLYCDSFQTPHGAVGSDADGDARYCSIGISLRRPFVKYSAGKRLLQEIEYGWRASRRVALINPGVVISANAPLIAALVFQVAMKLRRIPVVFWLQDVYSVAMGAHLERRLGVPGKALARVLGRVEGWILRSSESVVAISDDFLEVLRHWRVPQDRVEIIENWAPLDEVPVGSRPNPWSERHGISPANSVLLYAGTLGLKHQPSLLLELARAFSDDPNVRVIVASEGIGASWLAEESTAEPCLELIGFQPYDELPDMLASADILLVLLEPDAGTYSVPSKVLTYSCAGRPVLGAMPAANLASRIITSNELGVVVDAGDSEGFVAAAERLIDNPELCARMGASARMYAERTFDIEHITNRFAALIDSIVTSEGSDVSLAP